MNITTRLFVLLLTSAAMQGLALTDTVNGIEWTYTISSGKASVGGGTSSSTAIAKTTTGSIEIPASLGGYDVASVSAYAFADCTNLTSVTIPDCVTTIGNYAFINCSGLNEVAIPDSVAKLSPYAFRNCSGLTQLAIPESVTEIGMFAFFGCSGLESIGIPAQVTSIEGSTFRGCSGLKTVSIPDGVTNIGSRAFFDCSSLKDIDIPSNVLSIGSEAFFGCSGLLSITIPEGVPSIEGSMFRGCSGLMSITIPNTVTNIGSRAFYSCSSLNQIAIPDTVVGIGSQAFLACSGLSCLIIPLSVESIGDGAFSHTQLQSIYLPSRFEGQTNSFSIPQSCAIRFYDGELVRLEIGSSVESLVPDAGTWFFASNSTQTITVESPVANATLAGVRYSCTGWTGAGSVPAAGTETNVSFRISEESSLTWNWETQVLVSVSVSGGTCDFGEQWIPVETTTQAEFVPAAGFRTIELFGDTNGVTLAGTTLTIPADRPRKILVAVDGIPWNYHVENGCAVLNTFSIPRNWIGDIVIPRMLDGCPVTEIGNGAFYGCSGLTSVTIPEGVKIIGDGAFRDCQALRSVSVPETVTNIGSTAFYNCSSLTALSIPLGVTRIEDATFWKCSSLSSVTIPESVTSIGGSAFRDCSQLVSIILPSGVTSIEDATFYRCSGLTSILIPDCVTNIGSLAFFKCSNLAELTLPGDLDDIGGEAFHDCIRLSELRIPATVENIGNAAFYGAKALATLYLPSHFEGETEPFAIPTGCTVVFYNYETLLLSVFSNVGETVPAVGAFVCTSNSFQICSVGSPAADEDWPGVRYVCTGWTGTGSAPASGSGTNLSFRIREETSLTWNWETQVLVSVSVSSGTCDLGSQWIPLGNSVSTVIVPGFHLYEFSLSGDTDGVTLDGTTLTISADRPREIAVTVTETKLALDVFSAHGNPIPAGRTFWSWDEIVNASVIKPEVFDGIRLACTGWTGTGSAPASGSGTNMAFRIREETSLTWNWETQVLVSVSVSGGSCEFGSQWIPLGNSFSAEIVPGFHLYEVSLSGDTDGVTLDGTTLTIPADRPREVAVTVTETKLVFDVSSAHGTPVPAGRTFWSWNETVNASVVEPASSGGVRLACTGWTGTGSVPASGSGKSISFAITENSTLEWIWDERILVDCEIDCGIVGIEPVFAVSETNEAFGNITQGYRTYNYGLSATNLVPGSVSVRIGGAETFLDNGTGRLVRASASAPSYISYGSGSVNYETGLVSFYANSAATEPKSVSISYSSRTETGKRWIVSHETGGGSVWVPRNGQNVEFPFSRTGNACVWSLGGDTAGVIVDIAGGTISIPSDVPRSVRLYVCEFKPDEVVADNGGEPVLWTATGEWVSVADATASGGYCMRSAALGAGETASVTATAEGPGTLSFDWRISSARGHYARFYLDDVKTNEITRSTDWTTETHVLGEGLHAFRWTYEKGTGAASGSDAVFLDNVKWTPARMIALEESLDATNLVWATDGAAPWTPQTAVSSDGEDSAKSGDVYGGATSRLSTVVTNAGSLAWKWKAEVAGAAGVDVWLDGEDLYDEGVFLEGSSDWTDAWLEIEGAGEHVVVFEFWNNGTEATISDCAYIDCVSWTPAGGGKDSTVTTPESVPYAWLDEYRLGDGTENGYETAALATAANGMNKVWECYVAGLSPTNTAERFEARVEFENGEPVVTWDPDLGAARDYVMEGKATLGDGWGPTNAASRFFRVKVKLP